MRQDPSSAPQAHWSKDFVEHLRTVHLALIATSAALVIVALTTKAYSTAVAARELQQIQDLRKRWNPDFAEFIHGFPRETLTYHGIDGANDFVEVQTINKGEYSALVETDTLYRVPSLDTVRMDNYHDLEHLRQIPDTISGFGAWWNKIGSNELLFPTRVSNRVEVHTSWITGKRIGYLEQDERGVLPSKGDLHSCSLEYTFQPSSLLAYECMGGVGKYQTTFPVIQLDKVRLTNKILAHYIGLKQEDGPFETVFRDLSEFSSTNGVESLSALESMLTRVDMSDTPVFEAFGLKFPADLATLGGIVILISVQVYLYIYLRRLQGTLKADDEGWDVAWIAMDSSRLARTLLFVTLVPLPVLSLLTLEGETSSRLLRGYWSVWDGKGQLASIKGWHWTVDIRLLLMFVALILSSWLGALCWKYRPRLNAEADAPQDIIVESPS